MSGARDLRAAAASPACAAIPNCKPISCTPAGGGRYCGVIGDGCGGTLDCGTACPGGMACGAAPPGGVALPNVCPGTGPAGPVHRHRVHDADLHGHRDDDA